MFPCSAHFPKRSETCQSCRGSRGGAAGGCRGRTPALCRAFCVCSSVIGDLGVRGSGPRVVRRKRKRSRAWKPQAWFSKGRTPGKRGRNWSLALKSLSQQHGVLSLTWRFLHGEAALMSSSHRDTIREAGCPSSDHKVRSGSGFSAPRSCFFSLCHFL